jgi:hypothetical protein
MRTLENSYAPTQVRLAAEVPSGRRNLLSQSSVSAPNESGVEDDDAGVVVQNSSDQRDKLRARVQSRVTVELEVGFRQSEL